MTGRYENILHQAVREVDIKTLEFLISEDVDISLHTDVMLVQAGENNSLKIAKHIMNKYSKIINTQYAGRALRYALSNGHLDVVKFLTLIGVDIRSNTGYILNEPFLIATKYNRLEIVKWLLKNTDISFECYSIAAQTAIMNHDYDIVVCLYENFGINIFVPGYMVKETSDDIVKYLIKRNDDCIKENKESIEDNDRVKRIYNEMVEHLLVLYKTHDKKLPTEIQKYILDFI